MQYWGPDMIIDELESMLTEELSLDQIAHRLNVPPTSIINSLYDLHEEGMIDIILGADKIMRYRLRGPD